MTDSDRNALTKSNSRLSVSPGRLLGLIIPLAVLAIVGSFFLGLYWQSAAQKELERRMLARMLGRDFVPSTNDVRFQDEDGDLVADSPADDQCVSPARLRLSFIAMEEARNQAAGWTEVLRALGEKLNRPVDYVQFSRVEEQLAALRSGELHVVALNTGIVSTAVRSCGFVPICTMGQEDGTYGYVMQIIVPAGSNVQMPEQLRGHKITFTSPISNSGFKAPLVLLMDEYQMQPERDYKWGFSLSHEASIRGVADGRFEAAPIASDVLERLILRGDVPTDAVRKIYQSDRFPPWTVGYLYNLESKIRETVRDTLLSFDWSGTGLEMEFGSGYKFVAVSYTDDWATTRQIDEAVHRARQQLASLPLKRVSVPTQPVIDQPPGTPLPAIENEMPADAPFSFEDETATADDGNDDDQSITEAPSAGN